MIIHINSEKIIDVWPKEPIMDLLLAGWEWRPIDYFFGFFPVIVYTKPLFKKL